MSFESGFIKLLNYLLCVVNSEEEFLYVNSSFENLLGWYSDEVLGHTLEDFVHIDDWPLVKSFWEDNLVNQKDFFTFDLRLRTKAGYYKYLTWNAYYNQETCLYYNILWDISDYKSAEKLLAEKTDLFQNLFDFSGVGKALFSPEGKIILANKALSDFLGYTSSELIGKDFKKLSTSDKDMEWGALLDAIALKQDFYQCEKKYIHKSGKQVWGLLNLSVIRSRDKSPLYIIAQVQDITLLKQREKDLLEEKERLQLAERLAHLGSWEWDLSTDETVWSDEFYRICGLDKDSSSASLETLVSIIHPEDKDLELSSLKNTIANKVPYEVEKRLCLPDDTRYVITKGQFFQDNPTKIVGSMLDITEHRKITFDLERSKKELSTFLQILSHDLRAYVTHTYSFSNILLNENLDKSEQTDLLNRISDSSSRAISVIDNVRLLFQVREETEKTIVNLNNTFDTIIGEMKEDIQDRKACVEIAELGSIYINEFCLKHLILNLMYNALKFVEKDVSPVIKIQPYNKGSKCGFSITDNGIGFPEKDKETAFKLFKRLHHDRGFEGSGAGLGIVKNIVDMFDGEISIDSIEGEGSTFYIVFPCQ